MKAWYYFTAAGKEADLYIFGDIWMPSWALKELGDVSGYSFARDLNGLPADTELIRVHINSYGGHVSEGLAIHNLLAAHKARIHTYCDGFACSAASVIFMAGDERMMYPASLLMIHHAWTVATGNAGELRRQADSLESISDTAANVYRQKVKITEEELAALLDGETWIKPSDAVAWGFATGILEEKAESGRVSASARRAVFDRLTGKPEAAARIIPEANTDTTKKTLFQFGEKHA